MILDGLKIYFVHFKRAVLKIAEVVSRIEDRVAFIKNVESIGFKLVSNKVLIF